MKKYAIYRQGEIKLGRRYDGFAREPKPTRVATFECDDAQQAIDLWIEKLPAGGGWDPGNAVIETRWRGTVCDLWIRRYTPSHRYKGETHFMAYEVTR